MNTQFLMGNEAIAYGAMCAGVSIVTGYPGTPSTEVLETIASCEQYKGYVEWSVNEKAALEVAVGASIAGARTLVTMKQVGLNVASDPLMSLAYIGVKGGMVILVADDPGPISSQTEQDTRLFARFSKVPVFDPSTPGEAYEMMKVAFEYSERYSTPVIVRPTTRVCHGYAQVDIDDIPEIKAIDGFEKDSKWVIFPKLSYQNHLKLADREVELGNDFSHCKFNTFEGAGKLGIVASGISYTYVKEAFDAILDEIEEIDDTLSRTQIEKSISLLKIGTAYPFPESLASNFLSGVSEVVVFEELEPVIERELLTLCGKKNIKTTISGRITRDLPNAGEYSIEIVKEVLIKYLGLELIYNANRLTSGCLAAPPELPVRPPVLCAGCPHRASFYAVKKACEGVRAVFSGDIGCYTLGNAMPLDMVDTCLCMGAGVTMAQGLHRAEMDTKNFAFIGDSTFFASGITGVVNAVYNQTDIVLVILDNSTTAMTGHQPHPGTAKTMMGNISDKISIEEVLKALKVSSINVVDPLDLDVAISVVKQSINEKGVSAIIFRSPCVAVCKQERYATIDNEKCVNCKKCIKELGCPAICVVDGKVTVDKSQCNGCGICEFVCPVDAFEKVCVKGATNNG